MLHHKILNWLSLAVRDCTFNFIFLSTQETTSGIRAGERVGQHLFSSTNFLTRRSRDTINWSHAYAPPSNFPHKSVMTRSRPGPDPVPAPARPRTDPRRFIADALHVASCHVTPSRHAPLHDAHERVMECVAHRGPCGFSYLPYRPPYCIKGPVEPRSKISLVIEYHRHEILPTPHS